MISNVVTSSSPLLQEREKLYTYRAYGLNIHSALPLPELTPGTGAADVIIRLGKVEGLPPEAKTAYRYIKAAPKGIYLAWDGVGAFLVRAGREIIVEPRPGLKERVLRLFILGTTLAMLLHQRGELAVLHASVVAIDGQAVGFVGAKSAGKSTMAASLHARGHNLLSDDILAVDLSQSRPVALPGFPYFKLWPDSVAALGHVAESLPRLRPELEKRGYHLTDGFSSAPVPLKGIYVLDRGPEAAIEPIHPQQALLELMPHWYGARFGMELLQALGVSTHFLQCAALARDVPIYRFSRPRSLSGLPDVARLLEKQIVGE